MRDARQHARWIAPALCALFLALPAGALETDQYLAWSVELDDSAEPLNRFLAARMRDALAALAAEGRDDLPCEDLPPHLFREAFHNLLSARVRSFAGESRQVDRYPERSTGYGEYLGASIFRRPAFPFILPMARTIRVGDVYMGIDKFGHLFGFGRRYYRRYRGARGRGASEEEAMRRAVVYGIRLEGSLVGELTDGVFSHADLEANFQGLRLAHDLCEASPPYLARDAEGHWRLLRRVDLRDYVTPHFDESFHNSHYADYRWKRVGPVLAAEYCDVLSSPRVRRRFRRYRRLAEPSFSMRVVDEVLADRGEEELQERHSLPAVCGEGGGPRPAVAAD